jgi:hypothetical protein
MPACRVTRQARASGNRAAVAQRTRPARRVLRPVRVELRGLGPGCEPDAADDQASTVYGFHTPPLVRGASTLTFVEADPLYAWTNRHSGPYVVASTGVDLLTALFARRLGRQHPRLAVVGLYTLSALRFTAAAQNLHRVASLR